MKRALLLLIPAAAAADPLPAVTHEPPPRHLVMRPRAAQATSASPARPSAIPAAPPTIDRAPEPSVGDEAALRDLSQQLSFELDVGYQVEAANPTGKATLDARPPVVGQDYAALRSYGFAEVYASTRGLGLDSLSSYFAARFQAARRLEYSPAPGQTVAVPPPIATWFERSGVDIRYGWAELKDFLPKRWGMSKLRVRGGGQYVYGPWIMHMDGALVAYDGKILTASAYAGVRHSDYTRDQPNQRPTLAGGSVRVDLRGLSRPVPLAIEGQGLYLERSRYSADSVQPAAESSLLQADWRPRQDVAVIGSVRALNRKAASQRIELRARYKQVTNVEVDLTHYTQDDWVWDPAVTQPDADPTKARRYLDLGPVLPHTVGSARAGTLIAENVDLLVRGAFATEGKAQSGATTILNAFSAPYYEVGGALEVRLRRTVALGASLLTRQITHPYPMDMFPMFDVPNVAQPLPAQEYRGEEGFTELGGTVRMSLGARRFSALAELYGRRTRYAELYADPTLVVPDSDLRLGGRFAIDAWVGEKVRISATYDVSSALELEPAISGYRSLRLLLTGIY